MLLISDFAIVCRLSSFALPANEPDRYRFYSHIKIVVMKNIVLLFMLAPFYFSASGQAGNLDPAFGMGGVVHTNFSRNEKTVVNKSMQVLPLADGSSYLIIQIGESYTYITHRLPDGSADGRFGDAGYSAPLVMQNAKAVIQPDGKIVVGGNATNNSLDFTLARFNSNGSLDKSFSADGKQSSDFYSDEDKMIDLALGKDGKIVAVGIAKSGSNYHLALATYLPNGEPDISFSEDGKQTTDFSGWLSPAALAIKDDGRIVVTGSAMTGNVSSIALVSYLTDGSLDNSFLNGGKGSIEVGPTSAGNDIALQMDGKMLVTGFTYDLTPGPSHQDLAIVRMQSDGSLDSSFSGDGKETTDYFSNAEMGLALAIDNNTGKIYVAGTTSGRLLQNILLARFNPDGALDRFLTGASNFQFIPTSVAVQPDGRILLSGDVDSFNDPDYWILRYNEDGSLDNNFDVDGKLSDYKPDAYTAFKASAVQLDGKVIAVGLTRNPDQFAVARYNPDGSLDNTFSSDGKYTVGTNARAFAIAIQPDGKIIIGGSEAGVSDRDFALVRLNADGSPDNAFNNGNLLLTDNGSNDEISKIAIQPDGKIVVVGGSPVVIARYLPTGQPDDSFSGDGKLTLDFPSMGFATALLILPDDKILVAGYSLNAREYLSTLARILPDGQPDLTFSEDGYVVTPDIVMAAALQGDGKLIIGGLKKATEGTDFAISRHNGDGSPDVSFSTGGSLSFDLAGFNEIFNAVAVQKDGRILAGGVANGDFIVARLNPDGSFDINFSEDGKAITDAGYGDGTVQSINIWKNRLYAVGEASNIFYSGAVAAFELGNVNQAPIASAWLQKYTSPTSVLLAAWGSNDPDGGPITYLWEKFAGPEGSSILYGNSASPVITGLVNGNYVFQLTVTDKQGATGKDTIGLIVNNTNLPPIASTWLQKYLTPSSVLLAAWGSYDPEEGPITYLWEKTAGPAGSSLLYSNSASPVVTGLVNGTYSIRLTVTDNEGATGTSTYTFTVNNNLPPDNLPPVAGAWLQKYLTPTSALLAAWGSNDPEGGPITYLWEKTAGPEGAVLSYANSASPVISGLTNGSYTIKLTVTDNAGATGSKDLTFTVTGVPLGINNAQQSAPVKEKIAPPKGNELFIYPNPVSDMLTLKWENEYRGDALITVTNLSGQNIKSLRINKTVQSYNASIELNGLKPGQYYLNIRNGNKYLITKRFMKQ
jgi:uncharacterized delta-60 repeat protein